MGEALIEILFRICMCGRGTDRKSFLRFRCKRGTERKNWVGEIFFGVEGGGKTLIEKTVCEVTQMRESYCGK